MPSPARILVLSPSDLRTDPRVRRQLKLLGAEFPVTAAGLADPALPGVEFVSLAGGRRTLAGRLQRISRLAARRFDRHYRHLDFVQRAHAALAGREFGLIVANDADSWPLALALRGRGRTLCDAHEYAPREFEDVLWWRFLHGPYKTDLCRRFLPQADATTTVCEGIADEYARVFGVRPAVLMNVPPAADLAPSPVTADRIRMVHHGAAIAGRKIETMLEVVARLDARFTLDLMLVPSDPAYLARLRQLAAAQPRVRFVPPVPLDRIPSTINAYDVGLYLLEPTNFNNRHALPNKFFEFIQARLAVAIGPSPEMARIVGRFDCGPVAPDFRPETLAARLNALTPDAIRRCKENTHRAAQTLCWEQEGKKLQAIVRALLADSPCAA